MKTIRVMGIHGLGDHRNTTWGDDWEKTVRDAFPGQDRLNLEFSFVTYDPIFEDVDISAWEAAGALWKLTRSGVGSIFRRRGFLGDISDKIRWTAGYVVAWLEDGQFQKQTRALMLDRVAQDKPDIVLAHSLGSLITYDAFTHRDAEEHDVRQVLRQASYVSLGSQIGNPFVMRNLTPGRIDPLPVRHWYHLFNKEDDVFTAPIRLPTVSNFSQVTTTFDIDGFADHSAEEYLKHRATIENVWRPVAETTIQRRSFGPARSARRKTRSRKDRRPVKRALLVGINDYPNEADRLEGCVNDVFLMSSVLQECGFAPGHIRTCLDDRATKEGIVERLEWLVDDAQPGDERVFYYSGHGATVPLVGLDNEPDRLTETLVPWDFDWSEETAITDDQIFGLYSQLPYDMRLIMMFDCCHSGGIHRDGGARARGIDPPDDIRHRAVKWDHERNMWVQRDFQPLNSGFSADIDARREFFGLDENKCRMGRAAMLRGQNEKEYEACRKQRRNAPVGPYLPLVIQACQENEFSYEYRHGVVSYGAFTWALASKLRSYRRISFKDLVDRVGVQLGELGYDQMPQVLGPGKLLNAHIPWLRDRSVR